ncbi:MAG: S-methyl-5-thioribose-1-phosphate isomerase, partial [Marinobacter sp.]|nr:S-methyl-5-thioribose-1-phosphate isomerase [Marinobacter sp.]
DIPIEERDSSELLELQGTPIAPRNINAYNPVFDVTPASLIDVIVTERGVVTSPDAAGMARLFGAGRCE